MTDAEEITEIVRRTQENLTTQMLASRRQWTRDVKTALDAAGRAQGNWVCAGGARAGCRGCPRPARQSGQNSLCSRTGRR